MGDAMCQMRCLKEYKERNPDVELHFATCYYLHYLMATHTDLFTSVRLMSFSEVNRATIEQGWDEVIEFELDWENALQHGILRAWCEKTLGFTPSTDRPYFLVRDEERLIAHEHATTLRKQYEKLVLMQLTAPSGAVRSFRPEDFLRVFNLFPDDVRILYPGPVDLELPYAVGDLCLPLPGYDIGMMAALIGEVDYVFGAHGGTIMLAHAVGKEDVTQVMFGEGGSPNILKVPAWDNLFYPSNRQIDWREIAATISKRL